ncbi:MAG: hypothetical protein R2854_30995 [Caldilineaceae bacterium]
MTVDLGLGDSSGGLDLGPQPRLREHQRRLSHLALLEWADFPDDRRHADRRKFV